MRATAIKSLVLGEAKGQSRRWLWRGDILPKHESEESAKQANSSWKLTEVQTLQVNLQTKNLVGESQKIEQVFLEG